jgi:hypothetical protein
MKHIYTLFFLCLIQISHAQNFEGVIEMKQSSADGIVSDVFWYLKKDKLALEIVTKTTEGKMKIKLHPNPRLKNMIMNIFSGNTQQKTELSISSIQSEIDFSGMEINEMGLKQNAELGNVQVLVIKTKKWSAETEVVKDLGINLREYFEFFKNDYAIQSLYKSGKVGFPVNTTVKDNQGKVIFKTQVVSLKKIAPSDQIFEH